MCGIYCDLSCGRLEILILYKENFHLSRAVGILRYVLDFLFKKLRLNVMKNKKYFETVSWLIFYLFLREKIPIGIFNSALRKNYNKNYRASPVFL